jgi:hypothetical protein
MPTIAMTTSTSISVNPAAIAEEAHWRPAFMA